MTAKPKTPLAPLAVGPDRAAELLDMSRDHFERHVAHELRCIRRGRRKLYAIAELSRWLEREGTRFER
jgi:hypothetical protein